MNLDDTIVAISTPPGRGGIGIVRLAGAEAKSIAEKMVQLASGEWRPARASFGQLKDIESGERIDEVVVTWFAAPHSYTTDDVVEISCHGSPVVLERVLQMAVRAGARLASPGEFTQRAFLNGRLDLTQAEAVRDLIDAQTLYQAKVAARQMGGALSHAVQPTKEQLIALIARLEAGIDFADDDVAVMPGSEIATALEEIAIELRRLERSFTYGKLVHEGLMLAIVGRPNVGKSSLFNRLLERERAIVTAQAGTTRDLVTETVALGGLPVRLVDTAGIREALDEAEEIGIRKSMEALAEADLVLVVLDSSTELSELDRELLADVGSRPAIAVCNKSDLRAHGASVQTGATAIEPSENELPFVRTSATTGEGLDELRREILRIAQAGTAAEDSAMITNLRQHGHVLSALKSLEAAAQAVTDSLPHEMLLLDLYSALQALDELTGATTVDDILNLIFSTFCIGK